MAVIVSSPVSTEAPKSLASRYMRRASEDLKAMTLLVYGPSGIGKSRQLLRLSSQYPADDTKIPTGPLVQVNDLFIAAYDKAGMLSGLPLGLDVNVLPVIDTCYAEGVDVKDAAGNTRRKPMGIREFHRKILFPMLAEQYAAGVRVFCFDTITSMLSLVVPELTALYTNSQTGELDGMKYWPALNSFVAEFYLNTAGFPGATVVYTGHSKFKDDIVIANKKAGETLESATEKLQTKKETLDPYLAKITLDMPGKTAEPFMNQSSLVLALELNLNPKTQKYERMFIVHPGETEHRAKNRLAEWLSPKEPGDLRHVLNKINQKAGL